MQIIRAHSLGMCFGVRDAIAAAQAIDDPSSVAIHGELVHNERVLGELVSRGFMIQSESERAGVLPDRPRVMITAHGVSDRERARLLAADRELIDTTCPLVRRAHEAALALAAEGCFVIVIGRRGHVEVEGLIGDLERVEVIESPAEARRYGEPRLGVLCQTTTPPALAREVLEHIQALNPAAEILAAATICRPTLDRQAAVRSLLGRVDALVVVGGRHSNNTRQLAELARAAACPCLHIEGPEELDICWLAPHETIGLTAGTSTPDELINAVHARLLELAGRLSNQDPPRARQVG